MNHDERRALEELQYDYTPVAENIWLPLDLHVDNLQPRAEGDLLAALRTADNSTGPSPLGLVLNGQRGSGKTHLLHWFRGQVHAKAGYFFVVALLDAKGFWESVMLSVMDGLGRPWGGQRSQAEVLLYRLGEVVGASDDLLRVLVGSRPAAVEALEEFERLLLARDRHIAQTARATARALVLFVSPSFEHQEIAETYFQSEDDDLGARPEWGLPRTPRTPEELLRDLTMLMSLTGPVVIAVDQIDTLIAQSMRSLGDDQDDPAAPYLLLEQIGGGLMSLRERTRRTLTVVACLPNSWLSIKENATDSVADRFRETSQLQTLPSAEVARNLVATRFAKHFADIEFTPPFPTWPVDEAAFEAAVNHTPRRLLMKIDTHLRRCVAEGEVSFLETFGDDRPADPASPRPSAGTFDEFDARFHALRSAADPSPLGRPEEEDDHWPAALLAGLWAWVLERGERRSEFSVDPLPGQRPPIHARLRQVLDEETEDQEYWSFRAISADHHHLAALSRLRKACTAAALIDRIPGRSLVLLRGGEWSSGPKTQEALAAFEAAGGLEQVPSDDDIRALLALDALRAENRRDLGEWLEQRQIATNLELFESLRTVAGVRPEPSSPQPKPAPVADAGTSVVAPPTSGDPPTGAERSAPAPAPSATGLLVPGAAGSIPVGRTFDGDQEVSIRLEELRKHVAIFAGSGSGKTVLIRRLVEECALQGVSAIVLDPNNDLARLGDPWPERPASWSDDDAAKADAYLAGTEVVVWTPNRSGGRPLTFQPLPDFEAVRDDDDEFQGAVAVALSSLAPKLKLEGASEKVSLRLAVLRKAIEYLGKTGGGSLGDLAQLLDDLPYGVSDLADAKKIGRDLGQLLLATMVNDPLLGGTGAAIDPELLLTPTEGKRARISVISFVGLAGNPERQAFVNQLQMALFAWIRLNPAGDRPLGGLLVMDEAQNFASSAKPSPSTESTLALVSQARKYGLGLVFATQAPKGLHNQIPGNASTQFYGKLNAPAQIEAAREMARAKNGDVSDVSRLGVGEFYASFESGGFVKLRTLLCLSHHPPSPLTTEDVLARARG